MNLDKFGKRLPSIMFCLAFFVLSSGSVCGQVLNPKVAGGSSVPAVSERTLGLVTVNGGCSGTLLNQFWVLTARHCVTLENKFNTDLQPANQVRVTASWTARIGTGERIYDFAINSAAGSKRDRDIVLVYLGNTNLGAAGSQKIFTVYRDGKLSGRLKETDQVTQYGIGFSTFATDLKTPSSGAGPYRSAVFSPSDISATHYAFVMNASNQSGHGGDSGGPSIVTINGQPNGGIAGVQSSCRATGYVSGAPKEIWEWATGISSCSYVSTEPFLTEIAATIKEAPLKTPYITASQVIIPMPHWPFASVYLGWDGGPDHPNAEVYVSVNKGPETPAFSMEFTRGHPLWKQPKAGGEHKLPRNSGHYRYLLKSGGLTLSIVEFYVR